MKRKSKKWLVILLSALALITAAALLLTRRPAPAAAPAQTPTAPDGALEDYISQAVKSEPRSDSAGASIEAAILKNVSYTVTEKSEATAELSVTAPDMCKLVDAMTAKGGSQEEGQTFLLDALENGSFETVTTVITVELDENGAPVDSYAFADAMYGGLLSKYEELLSEAVSDK